MLQLFSYMGWFSSKPKIVTDEQAISDTLTRGVSEVIVKESLEKKLRSGKQLRIKLGIDPTSPDLHIGRAVPLLKLRDFQRLGHKVILIVGDFTAVIGDTSDKDAERPMLSPEVIEKNKKSYFEQAGKILDLSKVEMRYNSEWLKKLTYREIGEHADLFSVADFIARDNIKRRLDAGKRVSLRELLYPLMQGYDSVAIEADVELGGSDQKFNVLAGRPLQEHFKQRPQDVVLNPLIDGTDGTKMSSSKGNVIALTATPGEMYGKVMSMGDAQVRTYFELCTRVPMQEVDHILQGHPRDAKIRLAKEIVSIYHSKGAAEDAAKAFMKPDQAPEIKITADTKLRDIVSELGLSMSELRRLVDQKAIDLDSVTLDSVDAPLSEGVLKVGKHRFFKLTK